MAAYAGELVKIGTFGDGFRGNVKAGEAIVVGFAPPDSITYHMRGYDTVLTKTVFWSAPVIDSTAAYYPGTPGNVTNIVVQRATIPE